MHDIAVVNDIVLALDTQLAGFPGAMFAAVFDEIVVADGLGTDETALEVGVDHGRGLGRGRADGDGPGADFFLTGGELSLQI